MKKVLIIVLIAFLTANFYAQTPEKMSYQAVIRDSNRNLISNQQVGMRISILKDSLTGNVVYTETQVSNTNVNGLISIKIGGGTNFDTIDWSSGSYFIKTETDPTGGSNYTIIGTSQLLSVPYALFANNGSKWYSDNKNIFYNSGNVGIGTGAIKNDRFQIGDNWFFHDGITKAILYNAFWNGNDWEYSSDGPASFIELNRSNLGSISMGTYLSGIKGNNAVYRHQLTINNDGNIGVNNTEPERPLHINDILRIEPRSTAPSFPSEGDIYMNSTTHKLMVYDGTVWQACWGN